MSPISNSIVAGCVAVCVVIAGCETPSKGKQATTVAVKAVIRDAEAAVNEYQNSAEAKKLPMMELKSAEFTFKTVRGIGGGPSVNVLVFKASGEYKRVKTSEYSYTYEVPPPKETKAAFVLFQPSLKSELAKAIREAAAGVVQDKFANANISKFGVTLEFGVELKGSIAGEAPVSIVTVGGNISGSRNDVQSVKIVFGRKAEAKPAPSPGH